MLPRGLEDYLADHYGGRRGFVRYWLGQAGYALGKHRDRRNVDWQQVHRLVFICSGNICRSPLGEVVAAACGFHAASFGLHCTQGAFADSRAVAIGAEFELALEGHGAMPIGRFEFSEGDLLIGMEPAHLHELPAGFDTYQQTLIGLWAQQPFVYLHDPFTTSPAFFRRCELAVIENTKALCRAAAASPAARAGLDKEA